MVGAIVFGVRMATAASVGAKVSALDWERYQPRELVKSAPGWRRGKR